MKTLEYGGVEQIKCWLCKQKDLNLSFQTTRLKKKKDNKITTTKPNPEAQE